MPKDDLVGDIFGWVGTCISMFFYIAPVVPFLKLIKGKITYKESPGLLLLCSFMNCMLWVDYGLRKSNFQVYFANGLGGCFTLVYITIFLIYVSRLRILWALLYNLILLVVISGIFILCFYVVAKGVTGTIAMVFNILMYAAPGEKMITICRTGNYNLIPIWSTIGGGICAIAWGIFGLYKSDWNLAIPNILGTIFSILQLIIYLIYRKKAKAKEKEKEKPSNETQTEVEIKNQK